MQQFRSYVLWTGQKIPRAPNLSPSILALFVSAIVGTWSADAEAPGRLSNPHRWPCPPGYTARGSFECSLRKDFSSFDERDRVWARAEESAVKWNADIAKEKRRAEELKQEARRKAEEVQRAREATREAEEQRGVAERRRIAAEAERRAAETRRRIADAAAEEKRRSGEAKRRAIEAAAEEDRRAAKERRLADEKDREALAAENKARAAIAEEERRTAEAARQLAHEQQTGREAEVKEQRRHGIFGEESLREIVAAADHNTVRFEKYYKDRKFRGAGTFKHAGNAVLSKDIAIHIGLRHGEIVCFVDKDNAYAAADLQQGSRVSFSGSISGTAPLLGGTLQLTNCEIAP